MINKVTSSEGGIFMKISWPYMLLTTRPGCCGHLVDVVGGEEEHALRRGGPTPDAERVPRRQVGVRDLVAERRARPAWNGKKTDVACVRLGLDVGVIPPRTCRGPSSTAFGDLCRHSNVHGMELETHANPKTLPGVCCRNFLLEINGRITNT